ncbi:MAG: hypothetical protein K2X43_20820 [Hyphomonadaceae bacterium]|nr:hypothetical protein [Hyphomonadaceae bacterium]
MTTKQAGGYSVSYGREESTFAVLVVWVLAAVALAAAWLTGLTIWLALGVAAAGYAYYNFPLLETGRPTLGANQYGIFIQAFGLIRWRAIDGIDLISMAERDTTIHELQIKLRVPFGSALVADWRKQPLHRALMRLPWSMTHDNVVRVRLGPLNQPADEIHRTLTRMWRHFRS